MMPAFYLDCNIKGQIPASRIKQAQTADDSDHYQNGDVVEVWDHIFRWDEDCIRNSTMKKWRSRGDTLADAALPIILATLGDDVPTDLLSRLEYAVNSEETAPEVTALWTQLISIDDTSMSFDRREILRGQAVFYRYAPQILASLLQFSLAGGFSSPRISRVLNLTSYLVPPMNSTSAGEAPRITKASNDRTYLRLMETTQFVVDCMSEGAMEVGGQGWRAAVRVRLLHATMRRRLLHRTRSEFASEASPPYSEERDGVPISQEDYAATLSSFSGAPMLNIMKTGLRPTLQECEDYTALWKVIGFYLGIDEDILQAHMSSWHQCSRLIASSIMNLFPDEISPPPPALLPLPSTLVLIHPNFKPITQPRLSPDPWTSPATLPVLYSVCNRWPSPFTLADHCAASRRLIGPSLSDWLSIPETDLASWLRLHIGFAVANVPPTFANHYRRGWDAKRRAAMQKSVEAASYVVLGERQTKFRPRAEGAFEPRAERDEFGRFPVVGVLEAAWEWGLLYAEFGVVVLAGLWGLPLYVLWVLSRVVVGESERSGRLLFASSSVLVPAT